MNEITLKFNDGGGIEIVPKAASPVIPNEIISEKQKPKFKRNNYRRNRNKIVIEDECLAEEILSQKGECFDALYAVALVLNKHDEVIGKQYYFRKCDAVQSIIDRANAEATPYTVE